VEAAREGREGAGAPALSTRELHFEPLELFVGVSSLVLQYVGASRQPSAEVVFLDDEGKVSRYFAHYAESGTV
jgi:hypothetical protein